MPKLLDSHPTSNFTGWDTPAGAIPSVYQSFNSGFGGILNSCTLWLAQVGGSGTFVVEIYAHSGTYGTSSVPTGSVLATTAPYTASTLTGSGQAINIPFTGANKISLPSNTNYCLVVNGAAVGGLYVGLNGFGATHGGNEGYYSGGWTARSGIDLLFYVYADKVKQFNPNIRPHPFSPGIAR